MVAHLKLLPLLDCFPPQNELAHKFSGHLCAGSDAGPGQDDYSQEMVTQAESLDFLK
jgi:hypothetical protein